MTKRMTSLLAMLAVGAFAFSAAAFCPDENKAEKVADHKTPCGSKVKTVADGEKTPCGSKKVETVSDEKAGCGSHAKTVADTKGECPHAKSGIGEGSCAEAKGGDCPCPSSKSKAVALAAHDSRSQHVLSSLPKIKYKVGDEVMCCSKTASMMAEKSHKPMQYVVGDETFENEADAVVELASVLETKLNEMTAMQYAVGDESVHCPMTAKKMAAKKHATVAYRVAGIDFEDSGTAEKAVQKVKEAIDGVKLSYKVGDDSFCCDKMAGMKAKSTGKSMTFVVGETETPCDKHAKLLLANAKIEAAVAAASTLAS